MEDTLERINKAGLKFLSPLSRNQTFSLITAEAARLLNADWSFLYLARKNELHRVAAYPEKATELYTPRKRGFAYRAYKKGKTFFIPAPKLKKVHTELTGKNYGCAMYLPISDHKVAIGALVLFTYGNKRFTQKERKAIQIFSSYASLAIRKAALFEQIQETLVLRDHFISLAAHELRTPLTSINGYISLLHAKLSKKKTKEARWVDSLEKESKRLTKLVAELLEVNRLKAGQLQYFLRECSLVELVNDVLAQFRRLNVDRTILFENELGEKNDLVVADFDKLRQILMNLLDNAAKFSSLTMPIILRLSYNKQYFTLEVRDQGEGVEQKDLARIFDGFYKGVGNVKAGMALGLFFAKHVIAYHQGSIRAYSEPHKGTTVEIRLPSMRLTRRQS